jgi:hypothetical protein
MGGVKHPQTLSLLDAKPFDLAMMGVLIVRGREYTFAKGGNICQGLGSPLQNVHTLAILGFMEVAGMLLVNIRIDMN